jgi:hypothetical protein
LVAEAVPARELLAAVAEEAGTLLGVDATRIIRYETEEEIVYVAGWSASGYDSPSFDRAKLEGISVSAMFSVPGASPASTTSRTSRCRLRSLAALS